MSDNATVPLLGLLAGILVTVCALVSTTPGIIVLAPIGAIFAVANLVNLVRAVADN